MSNGDLVHLAELIKARNEIDRQIAALIGRPALVGHIGEYIAATVLGIELEQSATSKAIDGRFTAGRLASRTVNIKWYGKREGILDLTPNDLPNYYLVLISTRGDHFRFHPDQPHPRWHPACRNRK